MAEATSHVTHSLQPLPTAVEEIAELARRDASRLPESFGIDPDTRLVVVKLRQDERIETHNLERFLDRPIRTRGNATVHDPSDFCEYVNRIADVGCTTVWTNVSNGAITAVVNDHTDFEDAGWRDHTVELRLQADPDWALWHCLNGKLTSQEDFAEFIENVNHTIIEPDAATMLEVATTFSAKRSVDFTQATRLATGDVQLTCVETTQAAAGPKHNLEVPAVIRVRIAPWLGVETVDLEARLRWRIRQGQLAIGYQLLRSDIAQRDAFTQVVARVRATLNDGVPIVLGVPPNPIR